MMKIFGKGNQSTSGDELNTGDVKTAQLAEVITHQPKREVWERPLTNTKWRHGTLFAKKWIDTIFR